MKRKIRNIFGGTSSPVSTAPAPAPSAPADAPTPGEAALRLDKEAPRSVTPPEGYEVVLHKDALAPGKIVEVIIGGTAIAVANVDGAFHAIANACSHADGPLGEGSLDGCKVTCPYHGWEFDVQTGACLTHPAAPVKHYPVQVVGDAVCVRLA